MAQERWLGILTVELVTENDGATYLRKRAEQAREVMTAREARERHPEAWEAMLREELAAAEARKQS